MVDLMYLTLILIIVYLRQKWIKNYLQSKGKIWNIISELDFVFLRCNFDVNNVLIKLSSFQTVFLWWMLIFKHNLSPYNSINILRLKISPCFTETGIIMMLSWWDSCSRKMDISLITVLIIIRSLFVQQYIFWVYTLQLSINGVKITDN